MKNRIIISADMDNILFENRGKDYGAYQLRKNNRRYLNRAALIAFILFISATAFPKFATWFFVPVDYSKVEDLESQIIVMEDPTLKDDEIEEVIIIEKPEPVVTVEAFVAPDPNHLADENNTIAFNDDLLNKTFGFETRTGLDDFNWDDIDKKRRDITVVDSNDTDTDSDTFVLLDKEPKPINMEQIQKLIGYPEMAKIAGIEGKVTVRIYVDKMGQYVKHKLLTHPHKILEDAVESKLPLLKFTPGIFQNKPMKVWITIPFEFSLKHN